MRKSLSRIRLFYLFSFWLLTLFGIALAVREYDVVNELQQGIEVSDSTLFWNDFLQLAVLVPTLLLFVVFLYPVAKALVAKRNIVTSRNAYMLTRLHLKMKDISNSLFRRLKYTLSEESRIVLTYFLAIIICLFNPLTRVLVSTVYPAENLFHYMQQIRIALIFQLMQLFWVTTWGSLVYIEYIRKTNK